MYTLGGGQRSFRELLEGSVSVTVLGDVHHVALLPAEEEVADGAAQDDGQARPHIVRHDDQHQQVGERQLDAVQQRLDKVRTAAHALHTTNRRLGLINFCAISTGSADLAEVDGNVASAMQSFPEIFQSFVKDGHGQNADTRSDHAAHRRRLPLFEQNRALDVRREPHLHHHHIHIASQSTSTVIHTSMIHSTVVHFTVIHHRVIHFPKLAVFFSTRSDYVCCRLWVVGD